MVKGSLCTDVRGRQVDDERRILSSQGDAIEGGKSKTRSGKESEEGSMLPQSMMTEGDIKEQAARVGLMLFGLRHGIPVPDMQERLVAGLNLCELVSRGVRLLASGAIATSEDASLMEAFSGLVALKSEGAREAEVDVGHASSTQEILGRINKGQSVSDIEIDGCLEFVKAVYDDL